MSQLRSFLAVFVCGLFWTLLGLLLGAIFRHPWLGLVLGLIFGIVYTLFGSWAAEKFPLDVWEARLLSQDQAPNAYEMLLELSEKTDLTLPTLYTCPRPEVNALALAGRDGNLAVVLGAGLTRQLDRSEVQAVLALLTARLATGLMPGWAVTATLAGMPLYLGTRLGERPLTAWLGKGILAVFTPLAKELVRLGCDPAVILASDVHAAHLADLPASLPTALAKIEAASAKTTQSGQTRAASGLGTDFLFAVAPFGRSDIAARVARAEAATPAPES